MSVNQTLKLAVLYNVFYHINNHPIPDSRLYSDRGIQINGVPAFDDHYKSISAPKPIQIIISHPPHPPITLCAHADQETTLSINHQIAFNILLKTLAPTPIKIYKHA